MRVILGAIACSVLLTGAAMSQTEAAATCGTNLQCQREILAALRQINARLNDVPITNGVVRIGPRVENGAETRLPVSDLPRTRYVVPLIRNDWRCEGQMPANANGAYDACTRLVRSGASIDSSEFCHPHGAFRAVIVEANQPHAVICYGQE